jgi:hypothetical protein
MCEYHSDDLTSSASRQRVRGADPQSRKRAGGKAITHSEQVDRLAVVGLDDKVADVAAGGDPDALERVGPARALVRGRTPERDFGRSRDGRVREGRAETCGIKFSKAKASPVRALLL